MTSQTWLGRLRAIDIRILASIGAALLLIGGVMWVIPTTPDSNSFKFDSARRSITDARPLELGTRLQGTINDGSDVDYYRFTSPQDGEIDVRMTNGSPKMIPALRIFDANKNLVQDKSPEYQQRPGADIESAFPAQSNATYYLEVFTQRNTTGPYTLTVNVHQP
jgi:hypothetical protein